LGWLGRLCGTLQGFLDRWFVDGLVNRVGDTILTLGRGLRLMQTGRIQTYLVGLVAGSVLLVFLATVIPW
jgi:NADH-quinone oxidoreductase subunit L